MTGFQTCALPSFQELGFNLQPFADSHLCCGSAGTYSVTQPELSKTLRDRKLNALHAVEPAAIVSSNVGCISHLQSGTNTPVRHWIEVVDEALRSEEHTSELQSLMRISYAVF